MDIKEIKNSLGMMVGHSLEIGKTGSGRINSYTDCCIEAVYDLGYFKALIYSRCASLDKFGHDGHLPLSNVVGEITQDDYGHWWIGHRVIKSVVEYTEGNPQVRVHFLEIQISNRENAISKLQGEINTMREEIKSLVPEEIKPAIRHLDLED